MDVSLSVKLVCILVFCVLVVNKVESKVMLCVLVGELLVFGAK